MLQLKNNFVHLVDFFLFDSLKIKIVIDATLEVLKISTSIPPFKCAGLQGALKHQ